jgi:hypothetical protein
MLLSPSVRRGPGRARGRASAYPGDLLRPAGIPAPDDEAGQAGNPATPAEGRSGEESDAPGEVVIAIHEGWHMGTFRAVPDIDLSSSGCDPRQTFRGLAWSLQPYQHHSAHQQQRAQNALPIGRMLRQTYPAVMVEHNRAQHLAQNDQSYHRRRA